MMSEVSLVGPTTGLHESWLDSRDEWGGADVHQPGSGIGVAHQLGLDLESRIEFERWVRELLQPTAGSRPDAVPATNWWIVRGGRYLGSIQLRHRLNDFLADVGGHIGYGIRPSERRKGLAATALRQVLGFAGDQIGLSSVLITCDEENTGSRKTIEACGGVLGSVRRSDETSRGVGHVGDTLRFWVPTADSYRGNETSSMWLPEPDRAVFRK